MSDVSPAMTVIGSALGRSVICGKAVMKKKRTELWHNVNECRISPDEQREKKEVKQLSNAAVDNLN